MKAMNVHVDQLPEPSKVLFIDRPYIPKKSRRSIMNRDEVFNKFSVLPDFEMVVMEALPLDEQMRKAASAKILVGVHGAGLTHALFMRPGTHVIEIMPHHFSYGAFKDLAESMGVHYHEFHVEKAFTVIDEERLVNFINKKAWPIDKEDFMRTLFDVRFGQGPAPFGLTWDELKPFYRDQHCFLDIERLRELVVSIENG